MPTLYQEYLGVQRTKRLGVTVSAAVLTAALIVAIKSGLIPQPSPAQTGAGLLVVATGVDAVVFAAGAAAFAYLWLRNDGKVYFEWHDGRAWLETGVPPSWSAEPLAPLGAGALVVKDTATAKGNGVFAVSDIPRGTFIGAYEGDLLDLRAFYERHPDGVGDYCIRIDKEWCLDGEKRSADTSAPSGCHINHSADRFNVARRTRRAQKRVELFATRDIRAGEELLLDYGRDYWKGRESKELP